jgi:hypothetical protein
LSISSILQQIGIRSAGQGTSVVGDDTEIRNVSGGVVGDLDLVSHLRGAKSGVIPGDAGAIMLGCNIAVLILLLHIDVHGIDDDVLSAAIVRHPCELRVAIDESFGSGHDCTPVCWHLTVRV